ncbi:MAG: SDR family oxidoreductase [Gammaproteobacteria bacterium]|nr:SDR family oxidoreductase [Gammaproteobacteria bacterium]
MDLRGRRIVLTGATGGIGQAIAEELARQGAALLLNGRREEALQALATRLRATGAEIRLCRADLGEAAGREALRAAAEDFGAEALINNAGINAFAWLEDQDEATIAEQVLTNLLQPILLCRLFLPLLARAPQARILNIGSALGSLGHAGYGPYCASKFGLRGFSEALGRELADTGIRVGYLAPRGTRTGLNSPAAEAMNQALGNAIDDPAVVARAVAEMLEGGTTLRYLGQPEGFFTRLNGLLPDLVSRALRGKLPLIRRYAKSV